ncbi:MAG: helix-turn-helix transcriptional regulator [Prevotellaceae bacterium]|jgi:transcriptional regulator with XRE-family HTH domain|nr:helix-turn-helix transcriptional regulator [Prevotellaceae bacterium]
MNIPKTVRDLRKKKSFSQKNLAEKSGLSQTFISLFENGKAEISPTSLKKIAGALGVEHSIILLYSIEKEDIIHSDFESVISLNTYLKEKVFNPVLDEKWKAIKD